MTSVVQDWVSNLSLKMQTVLLLGTRGCDGVPKENPSKRFNRILRSVVYRNADTGSNFMREDLYYMPRQLDEFLEAAEGMPLHFVTHFMHACEIVAYFHPDANTQDVFACFYGKLCGLMHLNPETPEQIMQRLGWAKYVEV